MDFLNKLYYDPETGYLSKVKFRQKVRSLNKEIPIKTIDDFYDQQEITQRTKKIKNTEMLKIIAPSRSFQMDICFFNFTDDKILLFIDVLSRYVKGYLIKTRNMNEVLEKLKQFKNDIGHIHSLTADNEFNNQYIKSFCKDNNIELYTDIAKNDHVTKGNKLGIIDSFVRTYKNMIIKYTNSNDTSNIKPIYDKLINNYNNTIHTKFNDTPKNVFYDKFKQTEILMKDREHNLNVYEKRKLNEGSKVRIVEEKGKFDKSKPTYSKSLYEIVDKDKNKFVISDGKKKITKKYNELQIVNNVQNIKDNTELKKSIKQVKTLKTNKSLNLDDKNILTSKRIKKPTKKLDL